MESKSFRPGVLVLVIVALATLTTNAALAAEKPLIIRATAAHTMPDVKYTSATGDGDPFEVGSDSATGWGIGVELLATPRLGIALQYMNAEPNLTLDFEASSNFPELSTRAPLGVSSYSASLNLHLTPNRMVDLYVSPIVSYMSFDDVEFTLEAGGETDTARFDVKSDVAWGIGVGVDIPFGESGWLATASLNYLDSNLEVSEAGETGSETLGFDPFVASVGIGYRF